MMHLTREETQIPNTFSELNCVHCSSGLAA